jgi:micrococcal nuclease
MHRKMITLSLFALTLLAARHPPRPAEVAIVARVVDGDTLELKDGRKVRLLGVDCPELHHPKKPVEAFALEAKNFTTEAIAEKTIRLVFEKWNPIDKYGRLLAYVYREDGYFLNRELVAAGYAHVEVRWPFEHMEEFQKLEREAREKSRGLWGPAADSAPR